MPDIDELRSLLKKGDISILFSQTELKESKVRLSSSLITLPTFITAQVGKNFVLMIVISTPFIVTKDQDHQQLDPLPEDVIHALSKNKRTCQIILKLYPDRMFCQSSSDCSIGKT